MEIGDAYDLMLRLPRSSVDLIVTSPPYWGQRTYHRRHNWTILTEWTEQGNHPSTLPGYDWYRNHGGALGLEPLPE